MLTRCQNSTHSRQTSRETIQHTQANMCNAAESRLTCMCQLMKPGIQTNKRLCSIGVNRAVQLMMELAATDSQCLSDLFFRNLCWLVSHVFERGARSWGSYLEDAWCAGRRQLQQLPVCVCSHCCLLPKQACCSSSCTTRQQHAHTSFTAISMGQEAEMSQRVKDRAAREAC